jgi:hypothetical protein
MLRLLRNLGRILTVILGAVLAAPACSEEPRGTVLQDLDFEKPKGLEAPFEKNKIIDKASFTDIDSIDANAIQKFLGKTAYDRASFLETYQSNGVRASDAIARAARQYRINPIVLLVYAQTVQGLIGERNYPFPPERIEYVFRCGCLQSGNCLPDLAGFDRQVDCLARSLRVALDEIAAGGRTVSGWGPEKTSTTLDGQKVTPENDATAAIYNQTPYVNEGKDGGSWVFWNVYNLYIPLLDYSGPIGPGAGGRWIGEACVSDASCSGLEGATCATNYPGGHCTVKCNGECPTQPDRPEAFCAAFPDSGYCFAVCNPGAPACRQGYKCLNVARYKGSGNKDSKHVCYPESAQP